MFARFDRAIDDILHREGFAGNNPLRGMGYGRTIRPLGNYFNIHGLHQLQVDNKCMHAVTVAPCMLT